MLERLKIEIDANLSAFLKSKDLGCGKVHEAMIYAIENGGKRIRPLLLLTMLDDFDVSHSLGIPAACALEMIHTYSLIHDDLPAMDDDDFRRGKPSVHRRYNEAIAILAGDGLLTEAFKVAICDKLNETQNLSIIRYLSNYSGVGGMIRGQEIDLASEGKTLSPEQLTELQAYKTGKLLALPLIFACIIAKRETQIALADKAGILLGRAFQIQDDILDVTKTNEELGKDSNSDAKKQKYTAVAQSSIAQANYEAKRCYDEVQSILEMMAPGKRSTVEIIDRLRRRTF